MRPLIALLLALTAAGPAAAERSGPARRPGVVAHEWGVWKVRAGSVTHLAELAAESPFFVFRAPGAPAWIPAPPLPPPPPILLHPLPLRPRPRPPVVYPTGFPEPVDWSRPRPARKPVIFLTADRPTAVRVEVGFRGGGPWLYYPSAEVGQMADGSGGLVFSGRLVPNARAPLPPAPAGHFWHRLRDVGADLFLSEGGTAERFLFYDGPVGFERPFAVAARDDGVLLSARSSEQSLWLVGGGRYSEVRVDRELSRGTTLATGGIAELAERLQAVLVGRGLSPAEARSLLDTWSYELFHAPGRRALALVPRDLYDRMLPIRIDPVPAELVRVGLVIEELE